MKMKTRLIFSLIIIIVSIYLFGCKDNFSPTGNLKNDYATYCILDNRLNYQIVLVQKLYLDINSKEKLKDTKVVLSEYSGNSYSLKDTIINGLENFNTYYLANYKLKRDAGYRLTVMKDSYPTQWSDTYIEPLPSLTKFFVSQIKSVSKEFTRWRFNVYFPRPKSNPCSVRMFIEYKVSTYENSLSVDVPILFYKNKDLPPYDNRTVYEFEDDFYTPIYPSFITIHKWDSYYNVSTSDVYTTFMDDNLLYALIKTVHYIPKSVTIKGGYVIYYTIDATLYENFLSTGQESYSIRLDEPFFFTNFKSTQGTGLGYFGAVTADTTTFKIDPEMFLQFGFIDGQ
jgi:hypothetical protein